MSKAAPQRVCRVLVFRTGSLGDTICSIPAFRLLRRHFSDSELVLLCDRGSAGILQAPAVVRPLKIFDWVQTYPERRGLRTMLSILGRVLLLRPDLVLVLPQDSEPTEAVMKKKRFFELLGCRDVRAAQLQSDSEGKRPNEANRLIRILNELGIPGEKPGYDITWDDSAMRVARQRVAEQLGSCGAWFALFCGGGKSEVQRWPLDRYAAVMEAIHEKTQIPFIATGGDSDLLRYKTAGLHNLPFVRLWPPPTSIEELFALSALAAGYLGNDTGMAHVSAAVGSPAAVIMSTRAPSGAWDPDVRRHLVIRSANSCLGCLSHSRFAADHSCMSDISVHRVVSETVPFFESLIAPFASRVL